MAIIIYLCLWVAIIFPFVCLYHSLSYDIARERVKKMGRKGNYSYTVKHKWHGWILVRKSV